MFIIMFHFLLFYIQMCSYFLQLKKRYKIKQYCFLGLLI